MDTSGDARRSARTTAATGGRLRSITIIVVFDIAAPLAAYNLLRSAGVPAVPALLLSGVFPVLGVAIGAVYNRRLDVIGAVALAMIAIGTVLGLVTHSPRLVLAEGSVPTAVLGLACVGSLWARRPLMYTVVREFTGPDTAKGGEMERLWQHEEIFRRDFRVVTAVWGVAFVLEAAVKAVIVYRTSTGIALAITTVMPFLVGGIVSAWTLVYAAHRKKVAIRLATAADSAAASAADQSSQKT